MKQFFLKIFDNKKIIFFIFLLVFIFGNLLYFSHVVNANGHYIPPEQITQAASGTAQSSNQCKSGLSYLQSIEAGIPDVILWGSKFLANWATWLSSWIIAKVIHWPITNTHTDANGGAIAFASGWTSVRNLANMLVVLGFVVIGIATALRIREYEAKKFLGILIISALLINFSVLFVGLVIDGSNLVMTGLAGAGPSAVMGNTLFTKISNSEGNLRCSYLAAGNLPAVVMSDILFGAIYLAITFSFLYLTIILIARYAILGILFILSPLAFVFWGFPFPKAKDLWNQWWSQFLKWAFIGVSISFFLYIAGQMLDNFKPFMVPQTGDTYTWGDIGNLVSYLIIILMVIVVGIKISIKQSGVGALAAGAVMGLATGGAGLAMGAAGVVGKGALNKTGLTGLGTRLKDATTKAGENWGFIAPNTTTMNQQSRLNTQERTSRINSMTAEDRVRELQNPRFGHEAALDRSAIVKKMADDNQLGILTPAQRTTAIAEATSHGVRPKDIIGSMNSADIATAINTNQHDVEARSKGFKTLMERNDLDQITPAHRRQAVDEATASGVRMGDIAKSDYRYRDYDTGPNGRVTVLGSTRAARAEQLEGFISSMSGQQRRNIDVPDITPELLTSQPMNAGIIRDYRTADAAHIANFGTPGSTAAGTTGVINSAIDRSLRAAETAAVGNTNETNRIRGIRAEILRVLQRP